MISIQKKLLITFFAASIFYNNYNISGLTAITHLYDTYTQIITTWKGGENMNEIKCRGCNKGKTIEWRASQDDWMRSDNYGIPTGLYCDDCYKNNYPYKKDWEYDQMDAGESLEPDY